MQRLFNKVLHFLIILVYFYQHKKHYVQLSLSFFWDEESLTEAHVANAPPPTAQYANADCAVVSPH